MNKYVAREVGGLWAVATSTEIICNYLSEDLAIAAVNEKLGLNLTSLPQSPVSTFIATFQSAIAETAMRLEADDSVESLRSETQSEIDQLKGQLRLARQLVEAKRDFNSLKDRITNALNADPITRQDAQLTAIVYMAQSPEQKIITELEAAL